MLKIYHNTRCGKSRCALQVVENSGKPFEVAYCGAEWESMS